MCVNLLWDQEVVAFTHTLGFQDSSLYQELGDQFSCCIQELKGNTNGSTCGCCESKKEVILGLGAIMWSW